MPVGVRDYTPLPLERYQSKTIIYDWGPCRSFLEGTPNLSQDILYRQSSSELEPAIDIAARAGSPRGRISQSGMECLDDARVD
jgi:hypothetical protein